MTGVPARECAVQRRTVLVVDDDARNRDLLRARLEPSYDVLEAESGSSALDQLSRCRVDLVLLDVMMPVMNGFETCRAIKASHAATFLPVVLLTALNSQEDRNEGLAAGADEFLSKPIDHRELGLRVRALLTLRAQEEQIRLQVGELREKEAVISRQLEEVRHLQVLKDDMFSLIMHDLRNPLTGVIGFLDLLQQQLGDPSMAKARRFAERAVEGAQKIRDLLEEVLEVRRLEEDGLPVRREPVRVVQVAREAVSTLEGAAGARRVALTVSADDDPVLHLDRCLIRRVLENLIANAVKFSPVDDVVSVGVRRVQDQVFLEVSDRGAGIADSAKVRLFKKFGALESRDAGDRRRGFGLGLHLVKLVADAHGAEAFVRDREGGGSVFGVCFQSASAGP